MMKRMVQRMGRTLRALHRDEKGADMVEYILIVAVIVLPIAAVVMLYRNEIAEWARNLWDRIKSTDQPMNPT
jgi:Flp pilus assembly pilin Flp